MSKLAVPLKTRIGRIKDSFFDSDFWEFAGFWIIFFIFLIPILGIPISVGVWYFSKPEICVRSSEVVHIQNVTTPGIGGHRQKEYFLITMKDGSQIRQFEYWKPTPAVGSSYCLEKKR